MHYLAQNYVLRRIKCENRPNRLVCVRSEVLKKWSKHSKVLGCIFRIYGGGESPRRIEPKIFLEEDISDVITCVKFGDDRFRGLASAEGHILICHSPLTLTVVLTTFSYYRVSVWSVPMEQIISYYNSIVFTFFVNYAWQYWCAQYIPSRTGCQRSPSRSIEPSRSNTTQAFLLGEYFSNPRPDVILVFSNAHDQMTLTQYATDVDEFAQLIDQLVPPSTQVVWASKHAEDDSKKSPAWRNTTYLQDDGRRLTRLQWLNEANRILYAKMRQRFVDGRRPTLMFPDLLAMSQPARKELSRDGVHMNDHWYQSVMSFIFQSLCHH